MPAKQSLAASSAIPAASNIPGKESVIHKRAPSDFAYHTSVANRYKAYLHIDIADLNNNRLAIDNLQRQLSVLDRRVADDRAGRTRLDRDAREFPYFFIVNIY
jgi:hypothetical protein